MDLTVTIIGISLLLVFIIPIVLLNRTSSNKKKIIIHEMNTLAQKENTKISDYNLWSDYCIGIDTESKFLFYIHKIKEESNYQIIPLNAVKSCHLVKNQHQNGTKGNVTYTIDKIQLEFNFADKSHNNKLLDFYDSNQDNMEAYAQLELAEKWIKTINAK
jgi:hypothetical protein